MKRHQIFFLLCIILLASKELRAQKAPNRHPDVSIHIYDGTIWDMGEFWIDIVRNSKSIQINYKLKDSVRYWALRKDKEFLKVDSLFAKHATYDSRKDSLGKAFLKIIDSYTVYYKDSILLDPKNYIDYNNLLTKVANASKAELEVGKPGQILDRDFTVCTIISKGKTKVIRGEAELSSNRPQIYYLITSTLDLARDEKHRTITRIHEKFGY